MPHRIVAVFASPEFEKRRRLFGAFEMLYGLRLIGIEAEQFPAMDVAIIFASELSPVPPANGCDPPPLKWPDLRYVFDIKEDCNGKEAIQA